MRSRCSLRSVMPARNSVAVSLNSSVLRAFSDAPEDLDAKRRIDNLANGIFHGPMLHGAYPETLFSDTARLTDWSYVKEGDLATIHQPLDAHGLNNYTTTLLSAAENAPSGRVISRASACGLSSRPLKPSSYSNRVLSSSRLVCSRAITRWMSRAAYMRR